MRREQLRIYFNHILLRLKWKCRQRWEIKDIDVNASDCHLFVSYHIQSLRKPTEKGKIKINHSKKKQFPWNFLICYFDVFGNLLGFFRWAAVFINLLKKNGIFPSTICSLFVRIIRNHLLDLRSILYLPKTLGFESMWNSGLIIAFIFTKLFCVPCINKIILE